MIPTKELLDTSYAPSRTLIDVLIRQGIYILARAPKVGKSWPVLWLVKQVSKGEVVWGLKLGCANGAPVLQKFSRMETATTLDVTGREMVDTRPTPGHGDTRRLRFCLTTLQDRPAGPLLERISFGSWIWASVIDSAVFF